MTDKEIVLKTDLIRDKGYLYPTGTQDGKIVIYKIKSGRKKKPTS